VGLIFGTLAQPRLDAAMLPDIRAHKTPRGKRRSRRLRLWLLLRFFSLDLVLSQRFQQHGDRQEAFAFSFGGSFRRESPIFIRAAAVIG
jgi:hypothetical protein